MTKETGGPAFPVGDGYHQNAHGKTIETLGMTLRDYLAAKAMQALIIANPVTGGGWPTFAEKTAYLLADAMLKARQE